MIPIDYQRAEDVEGAVAAVTGHHDFADYHATGVRVRDLPATPDKFLSW